MLLLRYGTEAFLYSFVIKKKNHFNCNVFAHENTFNKFSRNSLEHKIRFEN